MAKILGIETSCDETAAAVYDSEEECLLSSHLFSQIELQKRFGGVVPEIASRSQLERIGPIVMSALHEAGISFNDIDYVAVTTKPGLIGSLLIGICYAKAIAWASNKKLIAVNHLEGHMFSAFLEDDGTMRTAIPFPHLCLSVSGGHTALYIVHDFGKFELIGETIDDAAGEAFDKIAYRLGFSYPGGPIIEQLAGENEFRDVCHYPRGKKEKESFNFSFSGLKTAVLYDLVKKEVFDFKTGVNKEKMTRDIQKDVASSLLICITEIFEDRIRRAFKKYPQLQALTFVGGVAANKFIGARLRALCERRSKKFFVPHRRFCPDNAAMIAFVGSYKAKKGEFASFDLDAFQE